MVLDKVGSVAKYQATLLDIPDSDLMTLNPYLMRLPATPQEASKLVSPSDAYKTVKKHRLTCPKWEKEFCLDCFGGGLTRFLEKLLIEKQNKELLKQEVKQE